MTINDPKSLHIVYLESVLAAIHFVPRDELGEMHFKTESECDLGKWMKGHSDYFRGSKKYESLIEKHKQFHDVLSRAVQLQVEGTAGDRDAVDVLINEARILCFSISELIDVLTRHIEDEKGRGKVGIRED